MSASQPVDIGKLFENRRRSIIISRTLNSKDSTIRRRINEEYLPKYRKKLELQRRVIKPPSQDRLSELTIKQIDRLIEMEKIKDLLRDNKKQIRPTHICALDKYPNRHPNVYQPNFLAKINRIAVQRNIRHLRSEEFDETVLSPRELRERGLMMQKRNLRFVKQYKSDLKKKKKENFEDQQEKSISSIEDNLEDFEVSLEKRKSHSQKLKDDSLSNFKLKKTNILSSTRWFNGMSTYYLDFKQRENKKSMGSTCFTDPNDYSRDFDYEYEESPAPKPRNSFGIQYSRLTTLS